MIHKYSVDATFRLFFQKSYKTAWMYALKNRNCTKKSLYCIAKDPITKEYYNVSLSRRAFDKMRQTNPQNVVCAFDFDFSNTRLTKSQQLDILRRHFLSASQVNNLTKYTQRMIEREDWLYYDVESFALDFVITNYYKEYKRFFEDEIDKMYASSIEANNAASLQIRIIENTNDFVNAPIWIVRYYRV